ncbi:MAG: formylglycine-generating enzyme family protein, partial [Byssovorax sp.]
DLVRLIAGLPPEQVIRAAARIGFDPREEPKSARIEADQVKPAATPQLATEWPSMPFVRIEEMTFTEGPEPTEPVARPAGLDEDDLTSPGRSVFATPRSPPLAPWSRLWPALQSALRASKPGRDPDVRALVRALGRGEIVRRVPRVARIAWSGRASVWIDRSDRLVPFWSDQADICGRLRKVCGRAGLDVRVVDSRWIAGRRDGLSGFRSDPEVPVLVLGDLGVYGSATERADWISAARRLRSARVRVAALVPSTPARWDPIGARAWGAVVWERGSRSAARSAREEPAHRDARAERLLRLISPAALVQPGLLRALRRLLPASEGDASTEADAWAHPDVRVADATGLVLHAEAAVRLRQAFADEEAPGLQALVSKTIGEWHEGLPRELLRMETLAWHALIPAEIADTPGDRADALAFAARVEGALSREDTGERLSAELRRFGRTMLGSMPDGAYAKIPSLKVIWAASFEGVTGARVPVGIDPIDLHASLGRTGEPGWWSVRQVGDRLVFSVARGGAVWPSGDRGPGSPVALLRAAQRLLLVQRGGEAFERQIALKEGLSIPLHPAEGLTLRTDRCAVTLGCWQREAWATAAGRDRFGLWADADIKGVAQRFRWLPPGQFLMGSPKSEKGRYDHDDEGPVHKVTLSRGRWLADTPVAQGLWKAVMGNNPSEFKHVEFPVEQVSYTDCQVFVAKLNQVLPALEARLPSEAEWEYACRAGTQTETWVGDLDMSAASDIAVFDRIAWYEGNSEGGTHPIQAKAPNPFGLYDMLGNVWEWCADTFNAYSRKDAVDPPAIKRSGSDGVFRGGSWRSPAWRVRAACRNAHHVSYRNDILGLRLARDHQPGAGAEPGARSVPMAKKSTR